MNSIVGTRAARRGGVAIGMLASAAAFAEINLEFRPLGQTVSIGATVQIGLFAVSDTPAPQSFSAVQTVVAWDPAYLGLLGVDDTGGVGWLSSGFPTPEPYGLNESNPPGDGDGIWLALNSPGSPNVATAAGTLLTTFEFEALAETPSTDVLVLSGGGSPNVNTAVFDAVIPNFNILGEIGEAAKVTIVPEPATVGLAVLGLAVMMRRR